VQIYAKVIGMHAYFLKGFCCESRKLKFVLLLIPFP